MRFQNVFDPIVSNIAWIKGSPSVCSVTFHFLTDWHPATLSLLFFWLLAPPNSPHFSLFSYFNTQIMKSWRDLSTLFYTFPLCIIMYTRNQALLWKKSLGPIMSNFWGRFFYVFKGKKIENITASALKSCIEKKVKKSFCLFYIG